MKGSFFTPVNELVNFCKNTTMNDQEGIYVVYETDPEVLARIVPPEVKPLGNSIFVYIINIQKPTFSSRYTEGAIGVKAECAGVEGIYWFSFLLSGPGREMATFLGREGAGIPKKLADNICVERCGDHAHASVTRHGKKLIEIDMDITGKHPDPKGVKNVLGDPEMGETIVLPGIFYQYSFVCGALTGGFISSLDFSINWRSNEKGTAEVKFFESDEDPWSELVVKKILGASYIQNDIDLVNPKVLAEVDATSAALFLWSARYDKGVNMLAERVFN